MDPIASVVMSFGTRPTGLAAGEGPEQVDFDQVDFDALYRAEPAAVADGFRQLMGRPPA